MVSTYPYVHSHGSGIRRDAPYVQVMYILYAFDCLQSFLQYVPINLICKWIRKDKCSDVSSGNVLVI